MILVKGLQKYHRSKLKVEKNICRAWACRCYIKPSWQFFFFTSNLDLFFCSPLIKINFSELSLERVPRVPGTHKILSSYLMAPVNFYEISREQLPGIRKILRPLICGTRGLKFLTTALGLECHL